MTNSNVENLTLWAVAVIVLLQPSRAYREISSLLDETKELKNNEIYALRPLFEELQMQYDFITTTASENSLLIDKRFQQQYDITLQEFEQQLNNMFPQEATTIYHTNLPTVGEIMGKADLSLMTTEQQMEFLDLQNILQDTLNEAQINLNDLVARALSLETSLLKINKPKVVQLIFKALKMGFKAAGHVGRAAYCTYSHLPQLNTSLHSLYEGLDCYLFTTSLIVQIQNETYKTVKTVKKDVLELVAVYKKVAKQNSLMGKIVLLILNVTKIARNILDTISTAKHVLNSVENQLPVATHNVVNCGTNFTIKVPFIKETVSNVTECILFVDDTKDNYNFMKSEEEYYKGAHKVLLDMAVDNEEI